MASLAAHAVASVGLVLLGVWQFCCSVICYVKVAGGSQQQQEFAARPWHACVRLPSVLRPLELYLHLVVLISGIVYELLSLQASPFLRMASLQHTAMLAMFFAAVLVVTISETTSFLPLPMDTPFLLAAAAFAVESMVVGREVSPELGLESECYFLLSRLALICAACCLVLAFRPKIFVADLAFRAAIIFQGSWLMQIGLSLFADRFIPDGCHRLADLLTGWTHCDLAESRLRAVALIDLAFICHGIIVSIVCVLLFGLIAKLCGSNRTNYDAIDNNEVDSDHFHSRHPKLVID